MMLKLVGIDISIGNIFGNYFFFFNCEIFRKWWKYIFKVYFFLCKEIRKKKKKKYLRLWFLKFNIFFIFMNLCE